MFSLFCDHDWQPRTGMDSGCYCTKCKTTTDQEFDVSRSSGLNNGQLIKNKDKSIIEKIFG